MIGALAALPLLLPAPQGAGPPAFERDVLPVLQKQGCSSAYCHGSATGRGGFQLSLFGSDPDADWRALTVDLGSRRVDFAHPERSLVLQKPARALPHEGGLRLPPDSDAHARVLAWIAAGAPRQAQQAGPRTLAATLEDGRLRAAASFADGSARDVTGLCTFASSDERVATIDDDGRIRRTGPGEAFLTARYAGADATVRLVSPGGARVPAPPPAAHPGDAALAAYLAELGLPMTNEAPSDRLARRLWLDLAGRPPSPDEHARFAAAPPDAAIADALDRLLAGPEFADRFAGHLARWFEVPSPDGLPPGPAQRARTLRARLRSAVADGVSLDALADELLAPGHALLEGIADPRDRAEYAGRAFLGLRIGCARCHDHPLDRWHRRDHLGFSALLATQRGSDGALQRGNVFDDDGRKVAPAMLGAGPAAETGDLWAPLRAAALGERGAFARNASNRLLGALLGRAPVEPVDDHRASNPPVAAPLLDALEREYRRTGGDLRALVRWIVTSAAYRMDSEPDQDHPELDALQARHFARRRAAPLDAARLASSVAFVLGAPSPPALPDSPLARELALQGGGFLAATTSAPGNPVDAITDFSPDPATALRELFVQVLSRPPRDEELAALLPELRPDSLRTDLRRLAEALCSTREFTSLR